MKFQGNSADNDSGGYIYGIGSTIAFDGSSKLITFSNNTAFYRGAVNGLCSSITFGGKNASVVFINNRATTSGGVFSGNANTFITFRGSTSVTFEKNSAAMEGDVIYMVTSAVIFYDTTKVEFVGNHASDGGACTVNKQL